MRQKLINFYGINFYNTNFKNILKEMNKGGYLVAPAASSLSKISNNKKYHNSLINADIVILDSGFFCILLRLFKRKKVKKLSGYFFLKSFLKLKFNKKIKFLNIDPNKNESKLNYEFLIKKKINQVFSYVAPIYKKKLMTKN